MAYSFLLCLFQIKELKNLLNKNYKNNMNLTYLLYDLYQNMEKRKVHLIQKLHLNSLKDNSYKFIILELFERLDLENSNEMTINNENNQFDKFDEEKSLKLFKKLYEKSSIIKKFFFIQKEIP